MNPGSWIALYLPIFVLLFVILPQESQMQARTARKMTAKRRREIMNHEMIRKYIGKDCKITTGSYGSTASGRILDVRDNWIELETRKGIELMNAEFVQSIKVDQ